MRTWEAYELHRTDALDLRGRFYRVMRSGPVVVTRFGNLGSPGRLRVQHLPEADALDLVANQLETKRHIDDYSMHYHDDAWGRGAYAAPDPLPTSPEEIERLFLDRWRYRATRAMSGEPHYWVVLSGLFELSRFDPAAQFVLEKIQSGVHALDRTRDLALAPATSPRDLQRHVEFDLDELGRVDANDTTDVIEAALGLYRPATYNPRAFMTVARRLVSVAN